MMFLFGLAAFLLGHLFYILAFLSAAGLTLWIALGAVLTGPPNTSVYH